MNRKRITLYRHLANQDREEVCSLGCKHPVQFYSRKFVKFTGRTWVCNNGYQQLTLPVYVDAQGRDYRQHMSIDFHNNVYYIDPNGHSFWFERVSYQDKNTIQRLVTGERIS